VDDKLAVPIEDMPFTMTTLGVLANTPAIPIRYQGRVNDMLAAAIYGREIGITPLIAINELYLVDGKVSMSGKLMSDLVHRAGHELRIKITAKATTVEAWRRDPWTHELHHVGDFQFSDTDANRAGLSEKATYKNYPMMMRTWRAITFACRTVFADCLGGVGYVPEELDVPEDQWDIEAVPLDEIDIIEADGVNMEIEEATMQVAEVMEVDSVRTMTEQ
jgi:hypothetical protein